MGGRFFLSSWLLHDSSVLLTKESKVGEISAQFPFHLKGGRATLLITHQAAGPEFGQQTTGIVMMLDIRLSRRHRAASSSALFVVRRGVLKSSTTALPSCSSSKAHSTAGELEPIGFKS